MRTKKGFTTHEIIIIVFIAIVLIAVVASVGLTIYAMIVYGDRPLSECPTWVWFLLQNRK